jgi:hypothetical protein
MTLECDGDVQRSHTVRYRGHHESLQKIVTQV